MKKCAILLSSLVLLGATTLTSCAVTINNTAWNVTKSIINAKSMDGLSTSDDRDQHHYDLSLSITISIANTKPESYNVERDNFTLSSGPTSWYMTNLEGTKKESAEVKGSENGNTVVTWVKLEAEFAKGQTYQELQKFKKDLYIKYSGTTLNLPTVIQFK